MATKFWISKFRKLAGKPSFCTMRAYFLAASRDCSSLHKQTVFIHCPENCVAAPQLVEMSPNRPLGSCTDKVPRLVDQRCGSRLTDPHDERLVSLKHSWKLSLRNNRLLYRLFPRWQFASPWTIRHLTKSRQFKLLSKLPVEEINGFLK